MDTETYERVFCKRAIDRRVAEGRPHVAYDEGDTAPIVAVDPGWAGKRNGLARIVNQSSGVAMMRHPATWLPEDPRPGFHPTQPRFARAAILAELRPDNPVLVPERYAHKHPAVAGPADPQWMHDHLQRPPETLVERERWRELADYHKRHEDPETRHQHRHEAKYVFPSGNNNGRRLDLHPDGRDLLEDTCRRGGAVFYALEGCLKADAILSAGHAAVSVPSVSLYWPQELPLFAERYLGARVDPTSSVNWAGVRYGDERPTVFVLTDSDWRKTGAVMFFGVEAMDRLTRLGVNAVFAAPPVVNGDPKTGVDDYLKHGGSMLALETVRQIVVPDDDLYDLVASRLPKGCGVGVRTAAAIYRWHLLHAAPDTGEVLGSLRRCADSLYPSKRASARVKIVGRARVALREAGLLHSSEPMRRVRDWYSGEWRVLPPVDLILPEDMLVRTAIDATVADVLECSA